MGDAQPVSIWWSIFFTLIGIFWFWLLWRAGLRDVVKLKDEGGENVNRG